MHRTFLLCTGLLFGCTGSVGTPNPPCSPSLDCTENNTITAPPLCSLQPVLADESFYQDRTEPEQTFEGHLRKQCPVSTPGGRGHCFFLGETPVYMGGLESRAVLERYTDEEVVIVGKLVPSSEVDPEIWPANIVCK